MPHLLRSTDSAGGNVFEQKHNLFIYLITQAFFGNTYTFIIIDGHVEFE